MTRDIQRFGLVVILALVASASGLAHAQAPAGKEAKQEAGSPQPPPRPPENQRLVPLSIEVVVSRYQGEKKVSSHPFTLAVNANEPGGGGQSQLRMGASVPVPSIMAPKGTPGGPAGPMPGPFTYRDIGTNIDCSARTSGPDSGFQVRLSVEDTSVYANISDSATPTVGDAPVFRTFRSTNTLVLRDGQTREFTAATDRVSGEVVRIAVTLRVVK